SAGAVHHGADSADQRRTLCRDGVDVGRIESERCALGVWSEVAAGDLAGTSVLAAGDGGLSAWGADTHPDEQLGLVSAGRAGGGVVRHAAVPGDLFWQHGRRV